MANIPTANNNPGDIRGAGGAFTVNADPLSGQAALYNDLTAKMTGHSKTRLNANSTLYDFAKVYAPKGDGNNDPVNYTAKLANQLKVSPDTKIGTLLPRIDDFAKAVANNEGYKGAWAGSNNGLGSFNTPTATPPPATPTPSVASTHPFNPQNPNSQFVDPNTPSVNTGVLQNLANITGLSKNSYAPIPNPLNIAKGIAEPALKGAATAIRAAQATPQLFSGNFQGAEQTMEKPLFGQATAPGSSNLQNIGSALNAGSSLLGLTGTLPAIANSQILKGALEGGIQGGLGGEGQYLSDPNRASLKTNQGMLGALTSGLSGIAGGAATGGIAAGIAPAMTGESNLMDLAKNKSNQSLNDKVWQMVKDPDLEPNTNKSTMTGTVASVEPTTLHDQQLIEAAKPYVTDDPIKTKNNLQNGVATQSQALQSAIVGKGGTWSETNLQGALNDVKIPLAIKGTAEMTLVKNVNNYVMELANDPAITRDASGGLELSKQFRQSISSEYGENIWNKDTPAATYIKNVNRALNDFTASHLPDGNLPDGTPYKSAMQKISLLSEARDNVEIPKAGKQTSTNALGKGLKIGKYVAKPLLTGAGMGEVGKLIP